jgi:hypothetical protein
MAVFQSAADIFICFFSVLGLYFTISCISDRITIRNAPSRTLLYIEQCNSENLEYLIRFYESRLIDGDFSDSICGILLPKNCGLDRQTEEKLCNEFKNIYFV